MDLEDFNYRTNLAIYQEFSQIIYYFINIFFVYIGIDALSAFVQYLLGYNVGTEGRAGGVINGSMMGLAMLLTLAFH